MENMLTNFNFLTIVVFLLFWLFSACFILHFFSLLLSVSDFVFR